jgi:hypothetical protein
MLSDRVAIVGQTVAGGFERYRLVSTVTFQIPRLILREAFIIAKSVTEGILPNRGDT